MNEKLNKQLQNSIIKRRLFIGGAMVLDSDFNIRNYLSDVQKQVLLEKLYFDTKKILPKINNNSRRLITNNYSSNLITMKNNSENNNKRNNSIFNTIANDKKPLVTLNNLLSLSKDNLFINHKSDLSRNKVMVTDLNIKQKLYEANNDIQSTKNNIEKMIKKNKESAKSSNSIFYGKLFKSQEPRLNIEKTVKEIKKREKSYSHMNTFEDNNKKIIQKNKTIDNDIVAFDKRHEEAVFEPLRIINDYKRQKDFQINVQENSINNFNSQNRQLSISSVLIKLMNSESNKIAKKYHLRLECLKKNQKDVAKNEINFEDYKENYRNTCKKIDQLYADVQTKNKELIEESLNCNSEIKSIQDEMKKVLNQIDYLRVYGFFVNKVLGGDTTRFESKIFPEPKIYDEINIDELAEKVVKQYRCFYDKNVENEKFEQEKTFINEPEKMWFKFEEMQGIMVRNIFSKELLKGDIKKIRDDNDINLKHLRQKNEFLQKENSILNEQYEFELSKYNKIEKRYNYHKNEFDDLIKNFYIYFINNFNKNNEINIRDKKIYNKLEIVDCIKEINKILTEKELYIDKLMNDLKNWEKNDKKCFEEVVNNRIKQIKHLKQLKTMKEKENSRLQLRNNMENGKFKVILHSRKTEAPYHKPKKVVEEKFDEKLAEQIENEELLCYEGD